MAGRCETQSEIQDYQATVARRLPRYAAMIAHPLVRGNTDSHLSTSGSLIDSAMAGDPWAPICEIYCSVAL